jgi:hypothetical protein
MRCSKKSIFTSLCALDPIAAAKMPASHGARWDEFRIKKPVVAK